MHRHFPAEFATRALALELTRRGATVAISDVDVAGLDATAVRTTTSVDDDLIFVSSGRVRGSGHFENVARTRRRGAI